MHKNQYSMDKCTKYFLENAFRIEQTYQVSCLAFFYLLCEKTDSHLLKT